jgi:hypothetical protein
MMEVVLKSVYEIRLSERQYKNIEINSVTTILNLWKPTNKYCKQMERQLLFQHEGKNYRFIFVPL